MFNLVLSLLKSAEFTEMCPRGKGFVPAGESSYDTGGENYKGQSQMHTSFQHVSVTPLGAWRGLRSGRVLLGHGNWWLSPLFQPWRKVFVDAGQTCDLRSEEQRLCVLEGSVNLEFPAVHL